MPTFMVRNHGRVIARLHMCDVAQHQVAADTWTKPISPSAHIGSYNDYVPYAQRGLAVV